MSHDLSNLAPGTAGTGTIRVPISWDTHSGVRVDCGGIVREVRDGGLHRIGYRATREELEAAREIAAHEAQGLDTPGGPCPLVEGDSQRHAAKVDYGQREDEAGEAMFRWAWFKAGKGGGVS